MGRLFFERCMKCKYYAGENFCTHWNFDSLSERVILCEAFEPKHHIADDSVKHECRTCFWFNDTCNNQKSCCYGEYRESTNFCGWWEYANPATNSQPENDNVNSPSHYNQGGIECIEALKAALGDKFIGFLVGNVLKYCWRYQHKNGLEDLRKAEYYLHRAIEEMSNEQPVP